MQGEIVVPEIVLLSFLRTWFETGDNGFDLAYLRQFQKVIRFPVRNHGIRQGLQNDLRSDRCTIKFKKIRCRDWARIECGSPLLRSRVRQPPQKCLGFP